MFYVGIVLICIVGTLLHFVYEWSHHNKIAAIFAAVNESTWEHIKICLTPTILWSLYDGYVYGLNSNYIIAKTFSITTIIILIPVLFYAYSVFTKKSILWLDVICFYATVTISQVVFYKFISIDALPFIDTYLCSILLFIEIGEYMYLTFHAPKNFLFEDPITHKYSLEGHPCGHDHKHGHEHNHEHEHEEEHKDTKKQD